MTNAAYRQFQPNHQGHDYITGDIHGCFSALSRGLKQLKFNPNHDRLFALGDIIDRGPESEKANEWLEYSWFHSIRGNHEDMYSPDSDALRLKWVKALSGTDALRLQKNIEKLPYAIGLETQKGLIGMVHAEVPVGLSWQHFTRGLNADIYDYKYSAIWDRERHDTNNADPVAGLYRLFVGHVKQPFAPRKLGNIYYIDTGAYERSLNLARTMFALTIVSPFASAVRLTHRFSSQSPIVLRT